MITDAMEVSALDHLHIIPWDKIEKYYMDKLSLEPVQDSKTNKMIRGPFIIRQIWVHARQCSNNR